MQIVRVGFGVTKNLGNYESLRLDMQADVSEGESPAEVLDVLRTQIAIESNIDRDYQDLLVKVCDKKNELARLVSACDRTAERLDRLNGFWNAIGNEIFGKFPNEIQALLSSYLDICSPVLAVPVVDSELVEVEFDPYDCPPDFPNDDCDDDDDDDDDED